MLLYASRAFLIFFWDFFCLLGAFGGLGGSIPLIFFHIPKLYIKTQLFQKIGFLIRGGDKKIEIFLSKFQELISHWSLSFHSNEFQYQRGLGLSFPKWYDTCIFVKKWLYNWLKPEEWFFWSNFSQNFKGLFGAL